MQDERLIDMIASRMDARFGPADVFDEGTWNETMRYLTGPTIDLAKASRARTARVVTSASTNPAFSLPEVGRDFIYGESAAFQFVFGEWNLNATDPKDMVHTPTELVEYFFRKTHPFPFWGRSMRTESPSPRLSRGPKD